MHLLRAKNSVGAAGENLRGTVGNFRRGGKSSAVDFDFRGRLYGRIRRGLLVNATADDLQSFGVLGGSARFFFIVVARSCNGGRDVDIASHERGGFGGLLPVAGDFDGFGLGEVTICRKSRAGRRRRRTQPAVARFLDGNSPADNLRRLRLARNSVRVEFGQFVDGSGVAKLA